MVARQSGRPASRTSAARLAEALRVAHLGNWDWDARTDHVTWSEEFRRIFGVDPRAVATYEAFLALVHPEDREATDRVIRSAFERGQPYVHWHPIVRPDGSERVMQSSGEAVRDEHGKPYRLVGTCLDVTESRREYTELNRSLSLLRATLDSTADGILVLDLQQKVVVHNQRFLQMWGLANDVLARGADDEALATVLRQLVEPARFLAGIRALNADPAASSFETMELNDGRVFERYSQPQRIGDDIVGRVWSFRDVSARHRAEAERDRLLESERQARRLAEDAAGEARFLADQAERALTDREEFLSVASHELRGPLTSVRLAVQSLMSPKVPVDTRNHVLEILARQTEKVSALVEDLLEVSRIRRGQFAMEMREVDLVGVVREVVARFEPELARTHTPVELSLAPRAVGLWDPGRLDQVVSNLLSNALKFGGGRPLAVRVEVRGALARLEVQDQGIGMSSDVAAHAFEPFKRGVSARHYGGLGLGLYIVERIVRALGGKIGLETAPGKGATFAVELPLLAGPDAHVHAD